MPEKLFHVLSQGKIYLRFGVIVTPSYFGGFEYLFFLMTVKGAGANFQDLADFDPVDPFFRIGAF